MTKFEQHIGQEIGKQANAFLENSTIAEIEKKARDLEFKSWCPVAMENDSTELRDAMKETSEMLFKYINFKKSEQNENAIK